MAKKIIKFTDGGYDLFPQIDEVECLPVTNANLSFVAHNFENEYDEDPTILYQPGEYCIKNNVLYRCIRNTNGGWKSEDWVTVKLAPTKADIADISDIINQWDEEWELGLLAYDTGKDITDTDHIRSKGYINIRPNTTYFLSTNSKYCRMFFYDSGKNKVGIEEGQDRQFKTPASAKYARFYMSDTYGTTYNNDISINYPHTYKSYCPARLSKHETEITRLNTDKADKLPRYKDITSYFTDGTLWNRISGTGYAHPYYDICVGDYLDMGVAVTCHDSYSGTTGSRYVTVASLGGLRCNGDSNVVDFPHLVMIPGQGTGGSFHFGKHAMNDTNTTEGGYVGSKMHTDVLGAVVSSGSATGTINQQLYNIFGAHLKTTRELLSNSINASGYNRFGTNSGCSNSWAWTSCQACLMSEVEVYGSTIWSSSGYDIGNAKRQFELFAIDEKTINNRSSWYWLKDVVSASYFALVNGNGRADYGSAGNAGSYVRPRFVIA